MTLKRILVGNLVTNCYVLLFSDRAAVIDPGDMTEKILRACENLPVTDLLLTHGHVDHVGAVAELKDRFDCRVHLHEKDLPYLNDDSLRAPSFPAEPWWRYDLCATDLFRDGDKIVLGPEEDPTQFTVIHTPGHTPGSSCFYWEEKGILFSGDTLFKGAEGRTDFPGSDRWEIKKSLSRLSQLPQETAVYPGHGFGTNVGAESWIGRNEG